MINDYAIKQTYYKVSILVLLFSILSIQAFSQSKNRITLQSGFASNALFTSPGLVGGGSHQGKGASGFGITYSRNLNKSFALETGLEYSSNRIETTSTFHPGFERQVTNSKIQMLSVPVYGNLTFLKYLFVNGGLLFSMETKISGQEFRGIDSQSGLGYGLALGGKYSVNKMTVLVNPFFQKHAVLAYKRNNSQERLGELGLKFGVGYSF